MTPAQPPDGAAKWAQDAAREIRSTVYWPTDINEADAPKIAAIILRHHAAHAATERDETVRLLEECADDFSVMAKHLSERNAGSALAYDIARRADTVRAFLTHLKEQTR